MEDKIIEIQRSSTEPMGSFKGLNNFNRSHVSNSEILSLDNRGAI